MTTTVYLQYWRESEGGWGQRPDGWSLHLTMEDHARYLAWCQQLERDLHRRYPTVDDYVRPHGDVIPVEVDAELFARIARMRESVQDDGYEGRRYGLRGYGRLELAQVVKVAEGASTISGGDGDEG